MRVLNVCSICYLQEEYSRMKKRKKKGIVKSDKLSKCVSQLYLPYFMATPTLIYFTNVTSEPGCYTNYSNKVIWNKVIWLYVYKSYNDITSHGQIAIGFIFFECRFSSNFFCAMYI